MTQYNLTYIIGTRQEYFLCGRWENQLVRVRYRRMFMDVNPDFFQSVVDNLNEQ